MNLNKFLINIFLKSQALFRENSHLLVCVAAFSFLTLFVLSPAFAQQATGAGIFKEAACKIAGDVMQKEFGAMISAIAGVLALVAAVTGNYKSAWTLVYVSIGAFIFKELVGILFGDTMNC